MKDGIYYGLTREQYDSDLSSAVNFSTLKHARKSLLHYRHATEQRDHEPTDAMILGTATHLAVLEPERFDAETGTWTGGIRRSKAWDAFQAEMAGRLILTESMHHAANRIARAVHGNRHAQDLLSSGFAEVTLLWTDPETGIRCRARADWVDPARQIVADLKTARDVAPRAFGRSAHALGYHLQLAWYAWGLEVLTGAPWQASIIAVESSEPHDVAVYHVDGDARETGESECRDLLAQVAVSRNTDRWPGQVPQPMPIMLPAWALMDDDADADGFGEEG